MPVREEEEGAPCGRKREGRWVERKREGRDIGERGRLGVAGREEEGWGLGLGTSGGFYLMAKADK